MFAGELCGRVLTTSILYLSMTTTEPAAYQRLDQQQRFDVQMS